MKTITAERRSSAIELITPTIFLAIAALVSVLAGQQLARQWQRGALQELNQTREAYDALVADRRQVEAMQAAELEAVDQLESMGTPTAELLASSARAREAIRARFRPHLEDVQESIEQLGEELERARVAYGLPDQSAPSREN